jgi:hypothetical protein
MVGSAVTGRGRVCACGSEEVTHARLTCFKISVPLSRLGP